VEQLLDPVPFPVTPAPLSSTFTSLPNLKPSDPPPTPAKIDEPILVIDVEDDFDFSSWDETSAIRLKSHGNGQPWLMEKMFSLNSLEGYLRTFSALHEYHERYPEDAALRGSEKGDIVDRLMRDIADGLTKDGAKGQEKEGEILGGWPLILMMIKKKL
jgi:hypothetical protein